MGLVVNSNSISDFGKKSNEDILSSVDYPDFNQILIKPSFGQITAIPSAVETVSGTPIHNISSIIYEKNRNSTTSGIVGDGEPSFWDATGATESSTLRVATLGSLKGGEIVGKTIVYAFVRIGQCSSTVGRIKFHAGLLHTDGTITYFSDAVTLTEKTFTGTNKPVYNTGGLEVRKRQRIMHVEHTNGVVALAGDRPIVDLNFTHGATGSGPAGFGNDAGGNATGIYSSAYIGNEIQGPCTPIQISIE